MMYSSTHTRTINKIPVSYERTVRKIKVRVPFPGLFVRLFVRSDQRLQVAYSLVQQN